MAPVADPAKRGMAASKAQRMSRSINLFPILKIILIGFLLGSCSPTVIAPADTPLSQTTTATEVSASVAPTQVAGTQAIVLGPDINPLTGLPVADPSLLQFPAL